MAAQARRVAAEVVAAAHVGVGVGAAAVEVAMLQQH